MLLRLKGCWSLGMWIDQCTTVQEQEAFCLVMGLPDHK